MTLPLLNFSLFKQFFGKVWPYYKGAGGKNQENLARLKA
jgi:hypothetical protein